MAYTSFKDLNFKQKLEHIWFYYKWYIIAAVFFLIAAVICIEQLVSRPNYDLTVLWAQSGNVSAQRIELAQEQFEKFCPDFNGDGEVNVEIRFVGLDESTLINPEEAGNTSSNGEFVDEYALMYKQQLLSEMAAGDSMIYVFDDNVVRTFKGVTEFYNFSSEINCACIVEGDKIKVSSTTLSSLENTKEDCGNYILMCGENTIKAKDKKRFAEAFEVIKNIIDAAHSQKPNPCPIK